VRLNVSCFEKIFSLLTNIVALKHSRLHSGQAEDWAQVRLNLMWFG
jgi:hypothetical protein